MTASGGSKLKRIRRKKLMSGKLTADETKKRNRSTHIARKYEEERPNPTSTSTSTPTPGRCLLRAFLFFTRLFSFLQTQTHRRVHSPESQMPEGVPPTPCSFSYSERPEPEGAHRQLGASRCSAPLAFLEDASSRQARQTHRPVDHQPSRRHQMEEVPTTSCSCSYSVQLEDVRLPPSIGIGAARPACVPCGRIAPNAPPAPPPPIGPGIMGFHPVVHRRWDNRRRGAWAKRTCVVRTRICHYYIILVAFWFLLVGSEVGKSIVPICSVVVSFYGRFRLVVMRL